MRVKPKEKYGKLIYNEPGTGNQLREIRTFKGKLVTSSKLSIFIGGRRNRVVTQEVIKDKAHGIKILNGL